MDMELKQAVKEIVDLVKECPENLQLRAFEMLLEDCLRKRHEGFDQEKPASHWAGPRREAGGEAKQHRAVEPRQSTGISALTLPMRFKAFLKKYSLDVSRLDTFFHIEDHEIVPIWDLHALKTSESHIQIAMFCSLRQALQTGEFSFDRQEVRSLCDSKKVPKTNFNANFKNSSKFFASLDREGAISLSDEGMAHLAVLIQGSNEAQ